MVRTCFGMKNQMYKTMDGLCCELGTTVSCS